MMMAGKEKNSAADSGLRTVEEWREQRETADAVFTGTCARNGWRGGRQITEAEYDKAVAEFLREPLGRR